MSKTNNATMNAEVTELLQTFVTRIMVSPEEERLMLIDAGLRILVSQQYRYGKIHSGSNKTKAETLAELDVIRPTSDIKMEVIHYLSEFSARTMTMSNDGRVMMIAIAIKYLTNLKKYFKGNTSPTENSQNESGNEENTANAYSTVKANMERVAAFIADILNLTTKCNKDGSDLEVTTDTFLLIINILSNYHYKFDMLRTLGVSSITELVKENETPYHIHEGGTLRFWGHTDGDDILASLVYEGSVCGWEVQSVR